MKKNMKKAIVIGCDKVGLGVIRSLIAAGVKIIAIPTEDYEFAHFSRFVSARTEIISPIKENEKLLNTLRDLASDWSGALLMPTNDAAVEFVAKNIESLSKQYVTSIEGWNIIKQILNKGLLYRQAQKLGIPIPRVFFPDSVEYLWQIKNELSFPCLIKPCETHKFFPVFSKKLFVIKSFEELCKKFEEIQRHKLEIMISEIIPGNDDSLYQYRSYVNVQGNIIAEMCTQKIRQHPPNFGVARVSRTIPIIKEIKDMALTLLRSYSFRGWTSSEFKFDKRDNKFKLMEVNVRATLPERLFFAAGINFPYIIYMDRVNGVNIPLQSYTCNIYWIDNFMDILGFFKWRKIENYGFKEYIRPYLKKKKVFCVPFFNDPLPFIVKSWILLRQTVTRSSLNN